MGANAAPILLAFSLVIFTADQENYYTPYLRGEESFRKQDCAAAIPELQKALNHRAAPKERSWTIRTVTSQRGFMPEVYLAICLSQLGRHDDAVKMGKQALINLKPGDKLFNELSAALKTSQNALDTSAPPPKPPPNKSITMEVDREIEARRFAAARQIVQRANVSAEEADALRRRIDDAEFDDLFAQVAGPLKGGDIGTAVTTLGRAKGLNVDSARKQRLDNFFEFANAVAAANAARDAGRWADARRQTATARKLGVDVGIANRLEESVNTAEANAAVAAAVTAVKTQQYDEAAARLARARELGVDESRLAPIANALKGGSFAQQLQEAEKSLAADQIARARKAAEGARDLGVNPSQAESVLRRVNVRDLELRLEQLLGSPRWSDSQRTIVEQAQAELERLDRANAVAARARQRLAELLKNLDASSRQRVGIVDFYNGRYQSAIDALSSMSDARALFYTALSKGALSLTATDPARRQALEQEGRQLLAQVGDPTVVRADFPYISPALRRLFKLAN